MVPHCLAFPPLAAVSPAAWLCPAAFLLALAGFATLFWLAVESFRTPSRRAARFPPRFRPAPAPLVDPEYVFVSGANEVDPAVSADGPRLRAIAEERGFELPGRIPPELCGPLGEGAVSAVMRKRTCRGDYLLCDLRREERSHTMSSRSGDAGRRQNRTSTSSSTSIHCRTTLVFVATDGTRFPPFEAGPNLHGPLTTRLFRLFRPTAALTVPGDAAFTERVVLSSPRRDAARPLLSPELRAVLAEHADLTVRASGETVIVSADVPVEGGWKGRDGRFLISQAVDPGDRPAFLTAAAEVVKAVRRAEAATRADRPALSAGDELPAPVARDGAIGLGTLPRAELDRFLREPAPRRLTPAVRKATTEPYHPWLLVGGGGCLLTAGGIVAGAFWLNADPGPSVPMAIPAFFGGLFAIAGATLIGISLTVGRRVRQTLRVGRATRARLTGVEATDTYVSIGRPQRKYLVSFLYKVDGHRLEYAVPLYGKQVKRAERRLKTGGTTRLLVDPAAADRPYWIDALLPDAEHAA